MSVRTTERTHRGASFGVAYARLEERVAGRSGPNGRRLCLGCESEIGARRRVWCSDRCSLAYWDAATWSGLRSQIGKRDRGICALCRVDCRALRRAYAASGKHERKAFAERYGIPKRRLRKTWWDADHLVPIAAGGLNALENLRTLCLPCHKAETKSFARRRYEIRRARKNDWPALLERAKRLLDGLEAR